MPARDLPQSDVALIDGFADHLALERHLAPSTVDAYRRDLSQLAAFLRRNRRDLPGARIDDLRRFLAQLTSLGYARASIARRVGAIHTFYRWAVSHEVVAEDPAALLGPAEGRQPPPGGPARAGGRGPRRGARRDRGQRATSMRRWRCGTGRSSS